MSKTEWKENIGVKTVTKLKNAVKLKYALIFPLSIIHNFQSEDGTENHVRLMFNALVFFSPFVLNLSAFSVQYKKVLNKQISANCHQTKLLLLPLVLRLTEILFDTFGPYHGVWSIINNPINVTENKWFIITNLTRKRRRRKERKREKRSEKKTAKSVRRWLSHSVKLYFLRLYINNGIQLRYNWINGSAMRRRYWTLFFYSYCECQEIFSVFMCISFTLALYFQHRYRPAIPFDSLRHKLNWMSNAFFSLHFPLRLIRQYIRCDLVF